MPAVGFTPIQLYRSSTPAAVPTAGNLQDGELAINTVDEKLYFKNSSGVVKQVGSQFTGGTLTSNLSYTWVDKGTVSTGTVTFTVSASFEQRLQVGGALTVSFTGWPTSGILGGVLLKMVNWGSATVTLPTINWQLPTGGFTTSFSTYLTAIGRTALQSSGTDFGVFWSDDAGTTVYGKLV